MDLKLRSVTGCSASVVASLNKDECAETLGCRSNNLGGDDDIGSLNTDDLCMLSTSVSLSSLSSRSSGIGKMDLDRMEPVSPLRSLLFVTVVLSWGVDGIWHGKIEHGSDMPCDIEDSDDQPPLLLTSDATSSGASRWIGFGSVSTGSVDDFGKSISETNERRLVVQVGPKSLVLERTSWVGADKGCC